MRDYSDLKFQAQSLCQRSNAILDLIAENELLAREDKELRDKAEEGLAVIRTMRHQVDCYIQDAERYRWLRNHADAMDWQFLSHQDREVVDQNIDCAMTPSGNESAVMEISEEMSKAISKRGRDRILRTIPENLHLQDDHPLKVFIQENAHNAHGGSDD